MTATAAVATPELLPQGTLAQVPFPVIERLVASAPFFAGCPRPELNDALAQIQAYECVPGAVLLAHENAAPGLGLLIAGGATAFPGAERDGGEGVEVLAAPDFFGEVGLLGGIGGYTVVADAPSRVLWLPRAAALRLLEVAPQFAATLARRLATRFSALCRPAPPLLLSAVEPEPEPVPAAPPVVDTNVLRFVEVSDFDVQPSVLALVPPKVVRQHRVLPLRLSGRRLTIGFVAPRNQAAVAEITRTLQAFDLEIVALSMDDFAQAIARWKIDEPKAVKGEKEKARLDPDTLVFETAEDPVERGQVPKVVGEEVLRIVSRLVAGALDRDASDIHLEPLANGLRVRFRVNGTLQDWNEQVPQQLARGVIARLKVVGGLDITERRRPQDGRIGLKAGRRDIDLRVSALPSSRGEKIVLRVLDGAVGTRPLGQVFIDPRVLTVARKALNRPWGGIVIAGATGSGKTSTLYSMLNERRTTRPDTHIVMVEDPIEYRLDGVTQVQVDHAASLGFAQVLRSMLRQDPDVIVVGEMRDAETARIGLEAATTGHVLLTSLHANDALGAVQRLEQLGCGRPLVSQSLALVLVQRLLRRLCSACRTMGEVPQAVIDNLVARKVLQPGEGKMLPQPVGCDACNKSGYVGRVAVIESLALNDEVRHLLSVGTGLPEVQQIAAKSQALVPFSSAAGHLLRERLITPGDALLTVAE